MRRLLRVCGAALTCLVLTIGQAQAASPPPRTYYPPRPAPPRYVPPRYLPPPPPPVLRTVDHVAVDNLRSFDSGRRDVNRVGLTFDADMTFGMLSQLQAGYVPSWYNREVIDVLHEEKVPATVFLTGLWARTYPDEARRLANDPLIELGSHTYDHSAFRVPCYNLNGTANPVGEIVDAQNTIAGITGITPRLLRFPGDCYSEADLSLASEHGLTVISGDVRSGDGFNGSASNIVGMVERNVRPGSIILMHLQGGPNAPNTAPALRALIPWLRSQGLEPVTVSELIGHERARPPAPVEAAPPPPPAAPVTPPTAGMSRQELRPEFPQEAGNQAGASRDGVSFTSVNDVDADPVRRGIRSILL